MQINSINDAGINITANVTVNVFKGDACIKTIHNHNAGTRNLFIGIARFLRGDFRLFPSDSDIFIPKYLAVGYTTSLPVSDNTLDGEITSHRYRFEISRNVVNISGNAVNVELRVVIPSGVFPNNTAINVLGLFPARTPGGSGLLARVAYLNNNVMSLKTDANYSGINVQSDNSTEIIWTISVANNVA